MKWKAVDKDFVAKKGNLIFRLAKIDIGFYGAGKAYSLKVRKKDEIKEEVLGYAFWFREDGSNRYMDKSVGGKLWNMKSDVIHIAVRPDIDAIQKEAEDIIKKLGF